MTGNTSPTAAALLAPPSRTVRRRRVLYVFLGYFAVLIAVLLKADPDTAAWLWQALLSLGALSLLRGLIYLLGARRSLLPEAQFGAQAQTGGPNLSERSNLSERHLSERQWRLLVAAQMNAYRLLGGLGVLLCLLYWVFLPASARLLDADSLGLLLLAGALLLIPNLPNALLAWTLDETDGQQA